MRERKREANRKKREKRETEFYSYGREEWIKGSVEFLLLDLMISFLFYRSVIAFFLFLPIWWIYQRERKRDWKKKIKRKIEEQFLDAMRAVGNALLAGYSIENAVGEGWRELKKIYGEEEQMVQEFAALKMQLDLNQTIEKLFYDLAKKSELESIMDFSQVFAAAKRTGGDLAEIIQNTTQWILEKNETKREITTCVTAKKTEQKIMSIVPCLMIGYVSLTSPGFLDDLYHNIFGISVMSGCLFVYGTAFLVGRRVVEIEV
ncbi:MAG: type II secretion protein F [Lachnospiraceae bacterium]|nr:type II secretion protein F [Robinsoniella sp.]MDY3766979.1 type II secretion protein F [Lachnospiraceae bacterium]